MIPSSEQGESILSDAGLTIEMPALQFLMGHGHLICLRAKTCNKFKI